MPVGCAWRAGHGEVYENTQIVIPECCYRGSQPRHPGPSHTGQRCPIITSGMTGCGLRLIVFSLRVVPLRLGGLFSFPCSYPFYSGSYALRGNRSPDAPASLLIPGRIIPQTHGFCLPVKLGGRAVGEGDLHSHAERGNERNSHPRMLLSGISAQIPKPFPHRAKMPDNYLGHDGLWSVPMVFSLLVVALGHVGLFEI